MIRYAVYFKLEDREESNVYNDNRTFKNIQYARKKKREFDEMTTHGHFGIFVKEIQIVNSNRCPHCHHEIGEVNNLENNFSNCVKNKTILVHESGDERVFSRFENGKVYVVSIEDRDKDLPISDMTQWRVKDGNE